MQSHILQAVVDERTQYEMYYPPFEGGVAAGLGSIMCSYNKICQIGGDMKQCAPGAIGNWSCTYTPWMTCTLFLVLYFILFFV